MKKYLYIALVLATVLYSCEEVVIPSPDSSTVSFHLVSATFNDEPIDPVPDYTLTFHFDEEGIPTTYEAEGTAVAVPTLNIDGNWEVKDGKLVLTADNDSREVSISVNEIDVTSEGYELEWSFHKTEIAWEYVGTYTFVMERVED